MSFAETDGLRDAPGDSIGPGKREAGEQRGELGLAADAGIVQHGLELTSDSFA